MSSLFEELDYSPTPIGAISLRRRHDLALGVDVYEIKLGDDFLMTSLFTASEVALGRAGVAACRGTNLSIVVGGLGLGYTAAAALRETRVRELLVVDRMPAVIGWHRDGLVPLGRELAADPRCRLVEGDFFVLAADPAVGFDPTTAGRRFDAVLLDIDHSPRKLLHGSHGAFYSREGLTRLAEHLHPGGVFALWSDDPPDEPFLADLRAVFAEVRAEIVAFPNPLLDRDSESTVYVAKARR
jgi:spermidine synthase